MESVIIVLSWTCVAVFILTSIVTLSALVGLITLGGSEGANHNYYMRRLFYLLIVEVLAVGVSAFANNVGVNREAYRQAIDHLQTVQKVAEKQFRRDSSLTGTTLPSGSTVAPRKDTLEASVYASSDGPNKSVKRISIPSGWSYADHFTTETVQNGDAKYSVELAKDTTGSVEAAIITAQAGDRSLFETRNWVGAILYVVIERRGLP